MPLLTKDNEILKLFYRIRYDTWKPEEAFYIRTSFYSRDEALSIFKDKFPTIEGKILIEIVSIN